MDSLHFPSPEQQARTADHYYGFFLLALAVASAAAPMFVESTLAWTLFLAGILGLVWLALDRKPLGFLPAAIWTLLALAMGTQLVFRLFLGAFSLKLLFTAGFIGLGGAEMVFGVERYQAGARYALIAGGAFAALFGVSAPFLWPDLPPWAGGAAMAAMFAGFGAALLIEFTRNKPGSLTDAA